jgi:hypothetical protein
MSQQEEPRLKIGILGAVTGTLNGGGEKFVKPIAEAGKRVPTMNNDAPGLIADAITLGNPGDFLYRVVRDGSEYYSVPDYTATPEKASLAHREKLVPLIDAFVHDNRDKIWLAPINEVDQDRADWIGEFSFWQAIHWNEIGYKVSMGGWASGTPYESAWYEDGMQMYLQYCADNPDKAAVCLHEYSYSLDSIWGDWLPYPYGIGRFQFLFMACDDLGIPRPKVHIGEFGWEFNNVPDRTNALRDIHEVGSMYDLFSEIQAAGVWYSGKYGNSNIDKRVNTWFEDWGYMGAHWEPLPIEHWGNGDIELLVDPITPDPEPEKTLEQHIWEESLEAQTIHLGDTALENFVASQPGYHIVGTEQWTKYGDKQLVLMPAEDYGGDQPRMVAWTWAGEWEQNQIKWMEEPEDDIIVDPPPPPSPPGKTYDLTEYIFGDGRQYEVRHANGSQETFQTQREGNTVYQVKNQQWEQFWHGDDYIWRGKDTSPGPAPDYAERPGELRWYWQSNTDPVEAMARWCRRYMAIGETWSSPYEHGVQFYYKKDCVKSSANSGDGLRNNAKLVAHYDTFVTDQGGTVHDVILLEANGEKFYFGKDWGLIQWGHPESESGTKASSFTGELHSGRPHLTREMGCFS